MKIAININMDNEAFEHNTELARILHALAEKTYGLDYHKLTDTYDRTGTLRDTNGNTVGNFKITGK
jgi:hypothetical protein